MNTLAASVEGNQAVMASHSANVGIAGELFKAASFLKRHLPLATRLLSCNRWSFGQLLLIAQVAVICAAFARSSLADDLTQEPTAVAADLPTQETISKLIARLAAPDFKTRRESFLALWEMGEAAAPALQSAISTEDRQIADSANVLIVLNRLEVNRQSSSAGDLVNLLTNLDAGGLVKLCEMQEWKLAGELLRSNPVLKAEFKEDYDAILLNRLIEQALNEGDLELVWPIVATLGTPETTTWLSKRLNFPMPENEFQDREHAAVKLFFDGEIDQALDLTKLPSRLVPMVTRSFRWDKLTDPRFQDALLGARSTESTIAAQAVLTEMSGDLERSRGMWDELLPQSAVIDPSAPELDGASMAALQLLRDQGDPLRGNMAVRNQLIVALLADGRPEPVEKYLEETNSSWAYQFYTNCGDYEKALSRFGLDNELTEFDQWLEDQRQLIPRQLDGTDVYPSGPVVDAARLAYTLHSLGETQRTEQLVQMMAEVAQDHATHSLTIWEENILRYMSRHEPRVMCIKVAAKFFPTMNTACQEAVLRGLFPEFGNAAPALFETAPLGIELQQKDSAVLIESNPWIALEHLHRWDRDYFGDKSQEVVSRWLRAAKSRLMPAFISADSLTALAKTAIGFGDKELALEILATDLTELADKPSPQIVNLHWLTTAQVEMQRLKTEKAASILRSLRTPDQLVEHAVVMEVDALFQLGEVQAAEQLSKSRWMRFVSNPWIYSAHFAEVGSHFRELEDYQQAKEYLEPAFLFSEASSRFLYFTVADYATVADELGQYQLSADVQRATIVEAMQPYSTLTHFMLSNGYAFSLRYLIAKERLTRAAACVASGSFDEATRHLEVARKLQPLDIEAVIHSYPTLVKQGEIAMADELLQQYETALESQLQQWPNDATSLNNLAWMYSQCNVKLDRALELARQAVALAPSSPVFLDTLAEVQFRLGDAPSAIESMRGCVKLDPRDKHYRENLVRFSTGR